MIYSCILNLYLMWDRLKQSVFLYLEGTFPVSPTCDPTCERKDVRNLWSAQGLCGLRAWRDESHLLCSSLIRTIMFRCPCEYCSITSRTSYGFLACCGTQAASIKAIVITGHHLSSPLGLELPRFVIIAQFNSRTTTAKVCKRSEALWIFQFILV